MLSVALAMYKLYWVELRQKQEADRRPSKRHRTEVMPPIRRENTIAVLSVAASGLAVALWNFILLVASLLPNLGARLLNILAAFAVVFIALYIFLSRGWGDSLVRSTQMAVLGLIFPNSSAVVKEF
jgi:cation transport ATPase